MVQLTLQDDQVLQLIRQLSPERQRELLMELARSAAAGCEARTSAIEERLAHLAQVRGKDWANMSDDDRLAFVNDLMHEDRSCNR